MNILGTQYTLNNKAYEIYLAGCAGNPHCEGCHNPESWDFDAGIPFAEHASIIWRAIESFDKLVTNIMILGGEPLDQDPDDLWQLVSWLMLTKKALWIFTRYEPHEIPKAHQKTLWACTFIKCGRYIPSLACDNNIQHGIKLATSNQRIYTQSEFRKELDKCSPNP